MIEAITYVISMLILFIIILAIKKTEKRMEIVKSIIINIILLYAYNAFIVYMLNLIKISTTLNILIVVNSIVSIILIIKIYKDKEIQKYELKKANLVIVSLFIVITAIICITNWTTKFNIKYVVGDSIIHYRAAREFCDNSTLTKDFMFATYINDGIAFKIFKCFIGTINLYKIYLILEAIIFVLVGTLMYFLGAKYAKSNTGKVITGALAIAYLLGYPLNSWITGFHYLTTGILFVTAILYVIDNCFEKENSFLYALTLMFFFNFGLMFSYCLFAIFTFVFEFIYFAYKFLIKEKSIKKWLLLIVITMLFVGIAGVTYMILPKQDGIEALKLEGYIYKSIWSNFILFIPFTVYYVVKSIKNKQYTVDIVAIITIVVIIVFEFIAYNNNLCSEYYLYKVFYALWTIMAFTNIKGINEALNKDKEHKIICCTIVLLYIIILLLNMFLVKVAQRKNRQDSIKNIFEIYSFNVTMMQHIGIEVTNEEQNLYKEFEKIVNNEWKYNEEKPILVLTGKLQENWIYSLTGHKNDIMFKEKNILQKIENKNYVYIIAVNNSGNEEYQNKIGENDYNIVYEDEKGKIYQRVGE